MNKTIVLKLRVRSFIVFAVFATITAVRHDAGKTNLSPATMMRFQTTAHAMPLHLILLHRGNFLFGQL